MAKLVVAERGRTWTLELAQHRVSVGRGRGSDIHLADSAASREHCAIEKDSQGYWLVDLGSRNGTKLNGRRVKGRALIRAGDKVEIGAARLSLETGPTDTAGEALARDPDTGLLSYAAVRAELERLFLTGASKVAVVKLDVDSLALLGSVFGPETRDSLTAAVAREVEAACMAEEPASLVGHEGQGKILVVLPGKEGAGARDVADAARLRVVEAAREGRLLSSVTLSAGIAASPMDAAKPRALLRRADAALAEAKRQGGDRIALPPGSPEGEKSEEWTIVPPEQSTEDGQSPLGADAIEPLLFKKAGQRALGLVARVLASDLDQDGLADFALSILARETKAQRGLLVLKDEAGELRLGAAVTPGATGGAAAVASHGLIRRALSAPDGILLDDAQEDPELGENESVAATGARSVVAAPIVWHETIVGAIYLENNAGPGLFDKAALELARAFGKLVAGPLRRGLLHTKALEELTRARLALQGTYDEDARLLARYRGVVGKSPAIKKLLRALDRIADRPLSVLITGDSGTGKEIVARALHARSRRARGPFIAENFAALSDEILEAELFGARKGAYTGADRDRIGLLEAAHDGTLFLDEVGDMSPRVQAKLLRFLESGELRPLGDDKARHVNVRVVAATNRDLRELISKGEFREDLYYRLAVLRLEMPRLRDRREDIPLLVEHFATRTAQGSGRPAPKFTSEALSILAAHDWPGNVRELENEVRKLVALNIDEVGPEQLSHDLVGPRGAAGALAHAREATVHQAAEALLGLVRGGRSLEESIDEAERELLKRVLDETGGNRSEMARRLGLSRPGLRGKLRRLGIEEEPVKGGEPRRAKR